MNMIQRASRLALPLFSLIALAACGGPPPGPVAAPPPADPGFVSVGDGQCGAGRTSAWF